MTFKIVYIFVEVGVREFNSRLGLAKYLSVNGYHVIIGQKILLLDLMSFGLLPPGIIYDKCCQITSTWRIRLLKKLGFIFTALDEEGIYTFLAQVRSRIGHPHYIDHLFANNIYHYHLIQKVFQDLSERPPLSISGNNRLPSLGNSSQGCLGLTPFIKGRIKVLLVGNFHRIDPSNPYLVSDAEALNCFLCIIKSLKHHSYIELAYRPHPAEDRTIVIPTCINNDVAVQLSGTLQETSQTFDLVVTHRCTSNIEFIADNKLSFAFKPTSSKNICTRYGSLCFGNPDEFFSLVKSLHQNPHCASTPSLLPRLERRRRLIKGLFLVDSNYFKHIAKTFHDFPTRRVTLFLRVYIQLVLLSSWLYPFVYYFSTGRLKESKKYSTYRKIRSCYYFYK